MLEQKTRVRKTSKIGNIGRIIQHPDRETLYDYVLNWLDETETKRVQAHLRACPMCTREVLNIMQLEQELEEPAQRAVWEEWVKTNISIPSELVTGISDFWQPQWAGEAVSAADIPEQHKAFQMKEGEIDISCLWRSQYGNEPAYIQVGWTANLVAERELWALFVNPETKETMAEIPLGTYLDGGKNLSSEDLGFDPSNTPWAIAILLKE